ncbi:MAG TPA: hypothetical protein VM911_18740 [Pyrinomonadaceae bacterium]|jgi:hypothetical protein|nr:hypothetical protein [Pyrinomonadaceae bacterium]
MFITSLVSTVLFMAQAADTAGSFDDLGKLLLGGLLSAIGVAIVVVFFKMKTQDKEGASNDFISISPSREKDQS